MEAKDRIIVALDVDSLLKAEPLIKMLAPFVYCFKAGLELIFSAGAPQAVEFINRVGGQIFVDGKFNDIPNTVAGAAKAIAKLGIRMFNVHCLSGFEALKKAREAAAEVGGDKRPLVLGVTILTSLNYKDLVRMGISPEINFADEKEQKNAEKAELQRLVKTLALMAQDAGLDGVICSPQEIKIIREYCQPEFLIVTPGVRPEWAAVADQKRVMTPGEAILTGADYLVIGRPIIKPPEEIGGPVEAVRSITKEIEVALKELQNQKK